jgi:hypothetical protein
MKPKRDKSLLFEVEKYLTNAGFVKQELVVEGNHSAITIVRPSQLIATLHHKVALNYNLSPLEYEILSFNLPLRIDCRKQKLALKYKDQCRIVGPAKRIIWSWIACEQTQW